MKDFKEESYAVTNTSLPAPWKARNQETRGDALTQPVQMRTGGNTERRLSYPNIASDNVHPAWRKRECVSPSGG